MSTPVGVAFELTKASSRASTVSAEAGAFQLVLQEVDTAAFVADFAEDATALADDMGANFILKRNDAGNIQADPGLLRQLLLNLVSNALHVSSRGRKVTLESFRRDSVWCLRLTDEGPGLPPEQLVRIFE